MLKQIKQWFANRSVTIEFKGQVEGILVQNELRRIESKLTARMDALEGYVDDVMEKYLRKITARENRAKQSEKQETVDAFNIYDVIRKKQGGSE